MLCFFTWLATRGVILTAENLRKRKVTCVSRCFICKESGEDVNHLLLHCRMASYLWGQILSWFGIEWVMSGTVKETMFSWAFRRRKRR